MSETRNDIVTCDFLQSWLAYRHIYAKIHKSKISNPKLIIIVSHVNPFATRKTIIYMHIVAHQKLFLCRDALQLSICQVTKQIPSNFLYSFHRFVR